MTGHGAQAAACTDAVPLSWWTTERLASARLIEAVGEGGSGACVWRALVDGRECAVKMLTLDISTPRELVALRRMLARTTFADNGAGAWTAFHNVLLDASEAAATPSAFVAGRAAGSGSESADDDADDAGANADDDDNDDDDHRVLQQNVARFVSEVTIMRQLAHPNTIQIYGARFCEADGQLQIFMQYRPLSLGMLVRLVARALRSLTAAMAASASAVLAKSTTRRTRAASLTVAELCASPRVSPATPRMAKEVADASATTGPTARLAEAEEARVQQGAARESLGVSLLAHWWTYNFQLDLARAVARGLAYLHSREPAIVHRDVKPDNIVVSFSGEADAREVAMTIDAQRLRRVVSIDTALAQAYGLPVTTPRPLSRAPSTPGLCGDGDSSPALDAHDSSPGSSACSTGSGCSGGSGSASPGTAASSGAGSPQRAASGCESAASSTCSVDAPPLDSASGVFATIQLIDFDSARELAAANRAYTVIGTTPYTAPEVTTAVGSTERADTWSFGMTLLEIMTARRPYYDLRPSEIPVAVCRGVLPALPRTHSEAGLPPSSMPVYVPGTVSSGGGYCALPDELAPFIALVRACLVTNPVERPTMARISALLDAGNDDDPDDPDSFRFFGVEPEDDAEVAARRADEAALAELRHYVAEGQIGMGVYGTIYAARDTRTGARVAIKQIDRLSYDEADAHFMARELATLRKLSGHPYIVALHATIETRASLFLVLELLTGGTLEAKLVAAPRGRLSEIDAGRYFCQLVSALRACQRQRVAHRDVKLENVMLSEDGRTAKLIDFGLCAAIETGVAQQTFCGSPLFVAPEVFLRQPYDAAKADVWSAGIVLYTLVSGRTAFAAENLQTLARRIVAGKFARIRRASAPCNDLIAQMLVVAPARRLSLAQVAAHAWTQGMAAWHGTERLDDADAAEGGNNDGGAGQTQRGPLSALAGVVAATLGRDPALPGSPRSPRAWTPGVVAPSAALLALFERGGAGSRPGGALPWPLVLAALAAGCQTTRANVEALRFLLTPGGTPVVRVGAVRTFLDWFGPEMDEAAAAMLGGPNAHARRARLDDDDAYAAAGGHLAAALAICRLPYFAGVLSGSEAERRLVENGALCSYVLRLGSAPRAYKLSVLCADNRVRHWGIEHVVTPHRDARRVFTLLDSIYLSIPDIVQAYTRVLLRDKRRVEVTTLMHPLVFAK